MSDYTPDRWVIIEIKRKKKEPLTKIFATWYGGFAGGEEWRFNSGIEKVEEEEDKYLVHGFSGSVYECYKNSQGLSGYGSVVLGGFKEDLKEVATLEILDSFKEISNG